MDVLLDRYVDEHVRVHNRPSTVIEVERLVSVRIRPEFGKMKVAAIRRSDVMKFHSDMRSTPRQANFTLSILSKAFNLGEVWGMRPDGSNPCRHLKRYPGKQT